jgi:hypothetical protein
MAAKDQSSAESWSNGLPPLPKLWDKDTLQALAIFALVSFGLVVYVLLVVKKQKKEVQMKDKEE